MGNMKFNIFNSENKSILNDIVGYMCSPPWEQWKRRIPIKFVGFEP
jgi:hypothetical protein